MPDEPWCFGPCYRRQFHGHVEPRSGRRAIEDHDVDVAGFHVIRHAKTVLVRTADPDGDDSDQHGDQDTSHRLKPERNTRREEECRAVGRARKLGTEAEVEYEPRGQLMAKSGFHSHDVVVTAAG